MSNPNKKHTPSPKGNQCHKNSHTNVTNSQQSPKGELGYKKRPNCSNGRTEVSGYSPQWRVKNTRGNEVHPYSRIVEHSRELHNREMEKLKQVQYNLSHGLPLGSYANGQSYDILPMPPPVYQQPLIQMSFGSHLNDVVSVSIDAVMGAFPRVDTGITHYTITPPERQVSYNRVEEIHDDDSKDDDHSEDTLTCGICYKGRVDSVCIPCGHAKMCKPCRQNYIATQPEDVGTVPCPFCKTQVTFNPLFL